MLVLDGRGKQIWKKEAEECIDFALNELHQEYRNIKINKLIKEKILNDYFEICFEYSISYVKGYLDSFKKAACLMTAIHKNKILFYGEHQILDFGKAFFSEKFLEESGYRCGLDLKGQLALTASLKLCENPVRYVGKQLDELKQLEKFNYELFADRYPDEWDSINYEMYVTSMHSEGNFSETLYKSLMFEYLYKYVNSKTSEMSKNDGPTLRKKINKKDI